MPMLPNCFRCLLWLALMAPALLPAFSPGDERLRTGIELSLSRFQLEGARLSLSGFQSPALRGFYQAHVEFYQFMAVHNRSFEQAFRQTAGTALRQIEALSDSEPLKYAMLAELYGKLAVVAFLANNQLAAVSDARNCRRHALRCQALFPERSEAAKLLAGFHIAMASAPQKYQWLIRTLGYTGKLDEGLRLMKLAAGQSSLLRSEAAVMAYYIEKNFLSRPASAIQYIEAERERLGPGLLLDFMLGVALAGNNQNDRALEVLTQGRRFLSDGKSQPIAYWDYYEGRAHYYKEDYARAAACFSRFLQTHQGDIYHSDASFRLAMAWRLQGDAVKARLYFAQVGLTPASTFDEDSYARQMARQFSSVLPNDNLAALFRARNRFDGGYLQAARGILDELLARRAQLAPAERLELHYRFGRLFQEQKQPQAAIEHYRLCTAITDNSPAKWMQAYAWLYIGQLQRQQGQRDAARSSLQRALAFQDIHYQNGLEARCKSELAALR